MDYAKAVYLIYEYLSKYFLFACSKNVIFIKIKYNFLAKNNIFLTNIYIIDKKIKGFQKAQI